MSKKYVGWSRLDAKRWSPLCDAGTREHCERKVEDHPRRNGDEWVVLPEGVEPHPGHTFYDH